MPTTLANSLVHPVRWASVGLGGYAGGMSDLLLEMAGENRIRYVSACDPVLTANPDRVAALRRAGISLHDSLPALLKTAVDVVWLPVPIDLHVEFTRQALAAGKPVLCEKPAAGCPADVDLMIAARDAAKLPVLIGFQHLYDPAIAEIKARLASGLIGAVHTATVRGAWPRDDQYYKRNTWAAKWKRDGMWVLDSPANNAMAHYLHLALFLLGKTPAENAEPTRIEAEHFRANPIETYDTTALRIFLQGGQTLLIYFTHASATSVEPILEFTGTTGVLRLEPERQATAPGLSIPLASAPETRRRMVETVSSIVSGQPPQTPVATLECARVQSLVVAASVQAARVQNFPLSLISETPVAKGGRLRAVNGIEEVFERCAAAALLPSETNDWPWAEPAGQIDVSPSWKFSGPA